ncbi:MAG: hypothetical protein ABH824_03910 [Nanoarchaeota archaeon]|nr:hypothetical protein [Nanoarchaeota archaeon]MBU1631581.1 hypothetical protein [Nanoarchaeota archaeon]MBU1876123.1 hypothetical protein [Nanoarchaeota archaeon]
MNKKAQFEAARKTIYWMIAGVVITIVVIAFAIIIASYRGKLTVVPLELRSELTFSRFVNSPECFAYQDPETGRVYPGVIDLQKYSSDRLNSCYPIGTYKDLNFGVNLTNTNNGFLRTSDYYYVNDLEFSKSVIVKDGNHFRNDILIVKLQEKVPK